MVTRSYEGNCFNYLVGAIAVFVLITVSGVDGLACYDDSVDVDGIATNCYACYLLLAADYDGNIGYRKMCSTANDCDSGCRNFNQYCIQNGVPTSTCSCTCCYNNFCNSEPPRPTIPMRLIGSTGSTLKTGSITLTLICAVFHISTLILFS